MDVKVGRLDVSDALGGVMVFGGGRIDLQDVAAKLCERYRSLLLLDTVAHMACQVTFSPAQGGLLEGEPLSWDDGVGMIVTDSVIPVFARQLYGLLTPDVISTSLMDTGRPREYVYRCDDASWQKLVVEPMAIEDGRVVLALILLRDVTEDGAQMDMLAERYEWERRRADDYARLLFDSAAEIYSGVVKIDLKDSSACRVNFQNGQVTEMPIGSWEVLFPEFLEAMHPDDRARVDRKAGMAALRAAEPGSRWEYMYRSSAEGGPYHWYRTTLHIGNLEEDVQACAWTAGSREMPADDTKLFATIFTVDITEDVHDRERLLDLSQHDRLTDLFNRVKLDHMKEAEYRLLHSCGVLFFDVNDLKPVNDEQGHLAGDALIRLAADSIRSITDRHTMGYRYGGDEFLVVAEDISEDDLDHLLELWQHRLIDLSHERNIVCSIAAGKAWSAAPFELEELIGLADKRMYAQKRLMKKGRPVR